VNGIFWAGISTGWMTEVGREPPDAHPESGRPTTAARRIMRAWTTAFLLGALSELRERLIAQLDALVNQKKANAALSTISVYTGITTP
jgi:hypothetical protein